MVHSNKVLTVSYGTFSCTLEGFEDSFDTMKAIAEYFRDLAADDRYFGAEPPQPDAEMLAHIAQREIARQVEARREGAGIVLRAAGAGTAAAPSPVATAPEEAATAEMAAPAQEASAPEAPASVEAAAPPTPETIVEAEPEAAPAVAPEVASEAPVAEAAEEVEAPEAPVLPSVIAAAAAPTEDAVAAFMATPMPEAETVEQVAAPAAAPAAPAADSIAAKLQRIRAVVSRSEQVAPRSAYDEDYSEDQLSDSASEAAFAAEAARDIAEALKEDDEEEPLALATEPEEIAYDQDAEEVALFDDLDAEDIAALAEDEDTAGLTNILSEQEEPAPVSAGAEYAQEAFAEAEVAAASQLSSSAQALPPGTLSPEDEDDLMRELAQVEAELRGDHARIADDEDADDLDEEAWDSEGRLVLTAPLAAEEIAPEEEPEEAEPLSEQAMRDAAQAANSDLSRLMAAADERLGDPETASTRETYSHLRAAVAATEAEQSPDGLAPQHPDAEAYRADLARVVHPRRPAGSAGRRARREEEEAQKPAPLKLVAEQRVDDIAPAPAPTPVAPAAAVRQPGPVRPRRVATAVETPRPTDAPGGGFAEFADEMGATELPELLEAAAAYMQFVEGREQFTRPQLIHKAREASVEEFNREDGLRSFGLLLREGKIVKKESGRFIASGEIGFQPASRAAG